MKNIMLVNTPNSTENNVLNYLIEGKNIQHIAISTDNNESILGPGDTLQLALTHLNNLTNRFITPDLTNAINKIREAQMYLNSHMDQYAIALSQAERASQNADVSPGSYSEAESQNDNVESKVEEVTHRPV